MKKIFYTVKGVRYCAVCCSFYFYLFLTVLNKFSGEHVSALSLVHFASEYSLRLKVVVLTLSPYQEETTNTKLLGKLKMFSPLSVKD